MSLKTAGIHHITSFAGDPQGNVDFYAGVLGLRLIKKTINFDAPEVYHLYFAMKRAARERSLPFFQLRVHARVRLEVDRSGLRRMSCRPVLWNTGKTVCTA